MQLFLLPLPLLALLHSLRLEVLAIEWTHRIHTARQEKIYHDASLVDKVTILTLQTCRGIMTDTGRNVRN